MELISAGYEHVYDAIAQRIVERVQQMLLFPRSHSTAM